MDSILPCPFCGHPAKVEEIDRVGEIRKSVGCQTEGCYGYMSMATFATAAQAIREWNIRQRDRKLQKMHPVEADPVEVTKALEMLRWNRELRVERDALRELLEYARSILASAGGGDWKKESTEWQAAAAKWRDEYHKTISQPNAVNVVKQQTKT